jgi:two-component system C4-dicarboxylate transport response regulator DctD
LSTRVETGEVILVDDDADLLEAMRETLELAGFEVRCYANANVIAEQIQPNWNGCIISDIRMPGRTGMEFLRLIQQNAPQVPFIVITAHGDVKTAIQAMKHNAYDFIEKSTEPQHLIDAARRALEKRRLQLENLALRRRVQHIRDPREQLIGRSQVMADLRTTLTRLGPLNVDVLLHGETGTGKDLTARCLHEMSPRAAGPLVTINCGAVTETDIDRELFGSETETGTFPGRIERAHGGTLYLDELDSMPNALQTRFLRVLEERRITRLGVGDTVPVDIRVVAGVKTDPASLVADGCLRSDLYHRMNVASLALPPVRERGEDVIDLMIHFLEIAAETHGLPCPKLSQRQKNRFLTYTWPGNVREIRNMAARLVIGLDTNLQIGPDSPDLSEGGYDAAMTGYETTLLQNALLQTGGRKAEAAELLGIPRKRLYLRLKSCGLIDEDGS